MPTPENVSPEEQKEIIEKVSQRLVIIEKNKELVQNLMEWAGFFSEFLEDMKNKKIITKHRQEKMLSFLENNSTLKAAYAGEGEHEKLIEMITTYPYVLDVDSFHKFNYWEDYLLTTVKNDKHGLVQLRNKSDGGYKIHTIQSPMRSKKISFIDKENWIIQIETTDIENYLLKLKKNIEGNLYLNLIIGSKYDRINDFDSDGIAFIVNKKKRWMVKKNITSDDDAEIQELIPPILKLIKEKKYSEENPPKFNEYNEFVAEIPSIGKVVLSKRYEGEKCIWIDVSKKWFIGVVLKKKYARGECVWVDVFKKSFTGKETKIEI